MRLPIARNGTIHHMDPVYGVENTINTRGMKSRTAIILITGVVAGVLIGAGTMAFLFRGALFFNIPAIEEVSALSYPPYPDQKTPDSKSNILISIPGKLVGADYNLLINKVVNGLNQVGINNGATLLPLFDTIKQKSVARDFNGLFDLMIQARDEIKKNDDLLATVREDIATLKKVNDEHIKDADIRRQTAVLLISGDALAQAYTDYFATLNETLSGQVPTQALFDRLAGQITSLRDAVSSFKSELDALLIAVQQKDKTSTK